MLSQGAVIAKLARERTGADQLASDADRGDPCASLLLGRHQERQPDRLARPRARTRFCPDGEEVTITRAITYVADPIPTAYVTNADYKKVVVTVTRTSDGHVLSQKTTLVSSASAPPYSGSTWVQVKRQVVDAVTNSAARRGEREPHRRPGHLAGREPHRHDGRARQRALPGAHQQPERPAGLHARDDAVRLQRLPRRHLARSAVVDSLDAGPQLDGHHPHVQGNVADGERPDFRRSRVHEPERPSRSTRRGAASRR